MEKTMKNHSCSFHIQRDGKAKSKGHGFGVPWQVGHNSPCGGCSCLRGISRHFHGQDLGRKLRRQPLQTLQSKNQWGS